MKYFLIFVFFTLSSQSLYSFIPRENHQCLQWSICESYDTVFGVGRFNIRRWECKPCLNWAPPNLWWVDKGDVSSMNLKLETTFNNLTDDFKLKLLKRSLRKRIKAEVKSLIDQIKICKRFERKMFNSECIPVYNEYGEMIQGKCKEIKLKCLEYNYKIKRE